MSSYQILGKTVHRLKNNFKRAVSDELLIPVRGNLIENGLPLTHATLLCWSNDLAISWAASPPSSENVFRKNEETGLTSFTTNQSTVTAVNQAVNRVLTSGKKMSQTFPLSGRDRLLFSRVLQAALSKIKIILNCIIRRFINISKMAVRKSACFFVYIPNLKLRIS